MRRSLRNLSWVMSADLLNRLVGFVVTTYLARVLGVDGLGVIGFSLAALAYAVTLSDMGLLKLGTRDVAKDHTRAGEYAAGIVGLRLMLAVIGIAGLGVFALVVHKPDTTRLVMFSYALVLLPTAFLLEWLFQGIEEMEHIAVSRTLLYVSYLVLVLIFVHRPGNVIRVPLLWLAGNVAASLYLLIVYRIRLGRFRLAINMRFWGMLMRIGVPLGIGTVLSQVYINFGFIALGLLATDQATGLYTAAARLVFFVMIVDRMFYAVAFPIVARRVHVTPGDPASVERARATMQQFAKLILLVSLPIAFCSTALAGPLMTVVYGAAFAPGGPVLAIVIWIIVTTTLNSLYSFGLIALGQTRKYAGSMVHGTLTVVVLSLLLGRLLGASGAAIALLAGEAVALGLMFTRFHRLIPVNPLRFVARPAAVSALLAAGLWWFQPARIAGWARGRGLAVFSDLNLDRIALAVCVIFAIAIYFGIMYLIHGFGKEEIALLRTKDAE